MEIPAQVRTAAQYLIDQYGEHVEHLGKYRGAEAFYYRFPDDVSAGFPPVWLLKGSELKEKTGFEGLEIVGSFVEDFSESDVK